MTWVWDHSPYTGAKRLLHLGLADHANDEGIAYPGIAHLAAKAACSQEWVRQGLQALEADGFIEVVEPGGGRSKRTVYRLLAPVRQTPNSAGSPETETPNSVGRNPQLCRPETPNSVGETPNSVVAYKEEPSGTKNLNRQGTAGEDAGTLPGLEPLPVTPTVNQRANALARIYCDQVPLSRFPAIAGIARKAIAAGRYRDDEIAEALTRLAAEGRPVTVDSLRVALEGWAPAVSARDRDAERQRASAMDVWATVAASGRIDPVEGDPFGVGQRRAVGR